MKINQLKVGSALSYAQMAVNILLGIFYTRITIILLGQSEYGLYSTVASTISMMTVLNLGFSASYIRFYSKYKKNNDTEKIYRLNGLILTIYLILAAIVLIGGLIITHNIEYVFDDGLTQSEYEIARVLMLLLTVSTAISFPMSTFTSIISAHEKFVFLKLIGIGKTVIGPLINIQVLRKGYGSIQMVSVSLALSIIVDTIYIIYTLGVLKQKFIFGKVEKGLFKSLFAFTFFIALNSIIDQINLNVPKVLLGRFQNTAAVAIYSVGAALHAYYQTFSTSISGVFTPRIHGLINSTVKDTPEQKEVITSLFTRVGRIQFLLLALIASGVIFFGKPFIYYWAGEGYEDSYVIALMLILPATIPLIQNLGIEIQRAQNRHRFRSLVYFIMALINLVITFFLSQHHGVIGAAVGTACSVIIANGIIMNIYYHKRCNINIIYFWKNILLAARGLIVPVIVGLIIVKFMDLYNIWMFISGILIYTAVYCVSMWFMGMDDYEKDMIKKPLKKIFRIK